MSMDIAVPAASDVGPDAAAMIAGDLTRASALARALASDLTTALVLPSVRVLDRDLISASARDIGRAHAVVGALPFTSAADLPQDLTHDLASVITHARAGARDAASVIGRTLDSALAHDFADIGMSAPDLARARDGLAALASAAHDAKSLADCLYRAATAAAALARAADSATIPDAGEKAGVGRVTRPAARLLATATWLLPAAARARYADEYRAELLEIAHGGQSRRAQLGYAYRQAKSSLRVRAALMAPRRQGIVP
jgi:hypothetical protein